MAEASAKQLGVESDRAQMALLAAWEIDALMECALREFSRIGHPEYMAARGMAQRVRELASIQMDALQIGGAGFKSLDELNFRLTGEFLAYRREFHG